MLVLLRVEMSYELFVILKSINLNNGYHFITH